MKIQYWRGHLKKNAKKSCSRVEAAFSIKSVFCYSLFIRVNLGAGVAFLGGFPDQTKHPFSMPGCTCCSGDPIHRLIVVQVHSLVLRFQLGVPARRQTRRIGHGVFQELNSLEATFCKIIAVSEEPSNSVMLRLFVMALVKSLLKGISPKSSMSLE